MIFSILLKNIFKNIKSSVIIILLIGVITLLFFIGNTLIEQSQHGLREAYIESITGDIVIQKSGNVTMNLFGANIPIIESYFSIPSLPAFNDIVEIISGQNGILAYTSQVSARAFLDINGKREAALLCGVDPETYFNTFNGIILEEGKFLIDGEYGAMITAERANRIERETGIRPIAGTTIMLTSGGNAGFKIREVPLAGIYRYKNPSMFMNDIIISDPQTARILSSIQTASSIVEVNENATGLLNNDINDLFGGESGFMENRGEEEFSIAGLENYLKSFTGESAEQTMGGDWNFIIIRVDKKASAAKMILSLNKILSPYGVKAVNWRIAAGQSAVLLLLIQTLFNAGIYLVSVTGIAAIINIILISVFKRTREIGTLRAIGANDNYIRLLIMGENLLLAVFSGLFGIILGCIIFRLINFMDIVISNSLIVSLFGSKVLNFIFMPKIAAVSFLIAVVLGFIASFFPIEIAVRIDPVTAVRKG
jgi:putative ABC transport system permease protein